MSNKTWLGICLITGLAGGLIGFGTDGTAQMTARGAGYGIIAPPIIYMVLSFLSGGGPEVG